MFALKMCIISIVIRASAQLKIINIYLSKPNIMTY